MPTVPLLSEETVLEMRRLCREDDWTIPRIVEHFQTDQRATSRAIRGISHAKLPGAVPSVSRLFVRDAVIVEMRRLCAEEGYSHIEAANKMGVPYKTATKAITGRTYQHIPNPVPPTKRIVTDEQVVEMRRLYRDENWTQEALAAYFGFSSPGTVSAVVRGSRYKTLSGATKKEWRSVSDATAIKMREMQRDNPKMTYKQICAHFDVTKAIGRNILSGISYRHLPVFERADKRRYVPEQILWMRLLYQSGHSLLAISTAYGCNAKTAGHMIRGSYYAEVPEATPLRKSGKPRMLTEEQVLYARRMYRTRYVSAPQIARELGVGPSIYNVIRGRAYKEIAMHVPTHIKAIRRGVARGPRKAQLESS